MLRKFNHRDVRHRNRKKKNSKNKKIQPRGHGDTEEEGDLKKKTAGVGPAVFVAVWKLTRLLRRKYNLHR